MIIHYEMKTYVLMVLLIHRNILTDRDVNGGAETLKFKSLMV